MIHKSLDFVNRSILYKHTNLENIKIAKMSAILAITVNSLHFDDLAKYSFNAKLFQIFQIYKTH